MKGIVSAILVTLMLMSMLAFAFNVQPIGATDSRIYIRADGSVDPPTAPISSVDNVTYTFTDNIYDSIVVERDNIVVDGLGYTLQGTGVYESTGIILLYRSNVIIKNTQIKTFYDGILLGQSSNNSISGNNITNNKEGISLEWFSNYNSISGNNIANNEEGIMLYHSSNYNSISGNNITNNGAGIDLSYASLYNSISGNNITNDRDPSIDRSLGIFLFMSSARIYHNNFVNNTRQVFSDESVSVWDDGYPSGGNYWSDYSGVDLHSGPNQNQPGSDGIGDTSYDAIDPMIPENLDRYPFMNPPSARAVIHIQHTWIGDLVVTLGVGDPDNPIWHKVVWNREGGSQDDLYLNVDLADAVAWLPPDETDMWYLQVYDGSAKDQGQITEFSITYLGYHTFSSADVPLPINDFETSYAYIPSIEASAHVFIEHTYRQDLIVDIGVGDPASPDWSRRIWNGEGGSLDNLDLTVDLVDALGYLPPTETNRWFLKVYDRAAKDQGKIVEFTITYKGTRYSSTDVPVPINDLKTSYAHIPSLSKAHIYIEHTYRGDLVVDIGVGNPSSPLWSQRVWNGMGGSADNLDLTVDLSAAVAYLPPSSAYRWFLKVYDKAAEDQGRIMEFTITYQGIRYRSIDVPVPINDLKTSYAYMPCLPPSAHILIEHTYRGDLIVDIGVGSPASPLWSKRVWNGAGGSLDNLDLTVDLSSAVAYLPPYGTHTWWIKVYDRASRDQGRIVTFTITYLGKTYSSPNVPVPIYDLKTSYAYIKS